MDVLFAPAGTGAATPAAAALVGCGVKASDQLFRTPLFPVRSSTTHNFQTPRAFLPAKVDSGDSGWNDPVNGAEANRIDVGALPVRTVFWKLAPEPPRWLISKM